MHNVELMSHIVAELTRSGMSDAWIMRNIGMDKDELFCLETDIRLKPNCLADKDFGMSEEWEEGGFKLPPGQDLHDVVAILVQKKIGQL